MRQWFRVCRRGTAGCTWIDSQYYYANAAGNTRTARVLAEMLLRLCCARGVTTLFPSGYAESLFDFISKSTFFYERAHDGTFPLRLPQ